MVENKKEIHSIMPQKKLIAPVQEWGSVEGFTFAGIGFLVWSLTRTAYIGMILFLAGMIILYLHINKITQENRNLKKYRS